MDESIEWYKSRTIWASIVGVIFGIVSKIGILPSGLEEADVVSVIMVIVCLVTLQGRVTAKKVVVAKKK